MVNGTALTLIRAFDALGTGTEAAPSAGSFVTVEDHHHFTRAKVYFSVPTIGGSGSPTIQVRLWGKQGETIVPLGQSEALAAGVIAAFDLGHVPVASFYATGVISGGTSPTLTGNVYVVMYNDWSF